MTGRGPGDDEARAIPLRRRGIVPDQADLDPRDAYGEDPEPRHVADLRAGYEAPVAPSPPPGFELPDVDYVVDTRSALGEGDPYDPPGADLHGADLHGADPYVEDAYVVDARAADPGFPAAPPPHQGDAFGGDARSRDPYALDPRAAAPDPSAGQPHYSSEPDPYVVDTRAARRPPPAAQGGYVPPAGATPWAQQPAAQPPTRPVRQPVTQPGPPLAAHRVAGPPPTQGQHFDAYGRAQAAPPPPPPRPPSGQPGWQEPSAPAPRRRKRRHWLRYVVLALLAYLAFTIATPVLAWGQVSRVDLSDIEGTPAAGSGHTYLLVGSDRRDDLSATDKKKLGTGNAEGARTDSIILVYVPSGGGPKAMISIPRDSFVDIPGYGKNKINAAFAFGGPRLLVETIQNATGLRIDGYLEIGFGGFATVVDALGGVDICVPFDMDDPKAHINLKKGCQTLDGTQSLGYVRARYSDPRGDLGRAERQRQFLGAVMKSALRPSTVFVPWTWWRFTHAVAKSIAIGNDTSLMDAQRIAFALRGASSGNTVSAIVPIATDNAQTSAGSSVLWNDELANQLFDAMRTGKSLDQLPDSVLPAK